MNKSNLLEDEAREVEVATKKEKKKKSVEERSRDRKAVFLVLFFVLLATLVFWLKATFIDKNRVPDNTDDFIVEDEKKVREKEMEGFYIKYKI